MTFKKILLLISLTQINFACTQNNKNECQERQLKRLELNEVSALVEIPSECILVDTSIIKPSRNQWKRDYETPDHTFKCLIFIDDYNDYSLQELNIERIASLQKSEIESGQNSKKLLFEKWEKKSNEKVGYIKYLVEQSNEKFYSGRFFFFHNKKLLIMWLFEKYSKENENKQSIMDCMFNTLVLN